MILLTDEDVMKILNIKDKRTLRRYRRSFGLDFIRMGRFYKYTQEMIDAFVYNNSSKCIKDKHEKETNKHRA